MEIVGWLISAAVAIFFFMRADEEAHRNVEVRRHLWEGKSTYEKEFKKYRKAVRWVCVILLILSLAAAIDAAIPLLR
jgi:hypothetical protein